MKNKIYISLLLLLAVGILSAISFMRQGETNFSEKHLIIVLRNIGHQLLLKAGDSTSSVLPIKKINEKTFQIEFQQPFVFVHDTLMNLVDKNLKTNHLPTEYIVNVLNCNNKAMIFGYEVSAKTNNIFPCTGRTQGVGCYVIQIEFLTEPSTNYYLFFLWLIPLSLAGYWLRKTILENKKTIQLPENESFIKIGVFSFFENKQLLKYKTAFIELSEKEAKLLKIFAENKNQLLDRERLLKAIWEDEGTIVVGRSLDVLVSKLRKKLLQDDALKIINIHGKGYKMIAE